LNSRSSLGVEKPRIQCGLWPREAHHTYRVREMVGISPDGVDAAIRDGLARTAQTTGSLDWFEVPSIRATWRTALSRTSR
jgi:flavin-binding protein dodecin